MPCVVIFDQEIRAGRGTGRRSIRVFMLGSSSSFRRRSHEIGSPVLTWSRASSQQ